MADKPAGFECVIPPDVAGYLGKKFFDDLVATTRKEMNGEGEANEFTRLADEDPVKPMAASSGY